MAPKPGQQVVTEASLAYQYPRYPGAMALFACLKVQQRTTGSCRPQSGPQTGRHAIVMDGAGSRRPPPGSVQHRSSWALRSRLTCQSTNGTSCPRKAEDVGTGVTCVSWRPQALVMHPGDREGSALALCVQSKRHLQPRSGCRPYPRRGCSRLLLHV